MDLEMIKKLFGESACEEPQQVDFKKPIKGEYVARISDVVRRSGVGKESGNAYDFLSLKLQIVEDVKGEPSNNRYIDINCGLLDNKYSTALDNIGKFVHGLYINNVLDNITINTDEIAPEEVVNKTANDIIEQADKLVDKLVRVYASPSKDGTRQNCRLVRPTPIEAKDDWS